MRERKRNVRHLPRRIVPHVPVAQVLRDAAHYGRRDIPHRSVQLFPYEELLQPVEDEGRFGGGAPRSLEEERLAVADAADDGEGTGGVVGRSLVLRARDVEHESQSSQESVLVMAVFEHVRIIFGVVVRPAMSRDELHRERVHVFRIASQGRQRDGAEEAHEVRRFLQEECWQCLLALGNVCGIYTRILFGATFPVGSRFVFWVGESLVGRRGGMY
mmetsp:Transcript_17283/g.31230  ORF Transcript_17283/g.31230 Transcript_17283/m.31230 type:complete len:216 (-) Transcript_17283:105-752(-)